MVVDSIKKEVNLKENRDNTRYYRLIRVWEGYKSLVGPIMIHESLLFLEAPQSVDDGISFCQFPLSLDIKQVSETSIL